MWDLIDFGFKSKLMVRRTMLLLTRRCTTRHLHLQRRIIRSTTRRISNSGKPTALAQKHEPRAPGSPPLITFNCAQSPARLLPLVSVRYLPPVGAHSHALLPSRRAKMSGSSNRLRPCPETDEGEGVGWEEDEEPNHEQFDRGDQERQPTEDAEAENAAGESENLWDNLWETPLGDIKPDPLPPSKRKTKEPWFIRNGEKSAFIRREEREDGEYVTNRGDSLDLIPDTAFVEVQVEDPIPPKCLDPAAYFAAFDKELFRKDRKRKPKIDFVNGETETDEMELDLFLKSQLRPPEKANIRKNKKGWKKESFKLGDVPVYNATRGKELRPKTLFAHVEESESQVLTPAMMWVWVGKCG